MLAPSVGLPHEKDLFAGLVAGHQHEDRFLLIDAGEIEQTAVLAVLVVHIERVDASRCAPEDGECVGPELLHRASPTGFQILLKWTGCDRRWDEQRDRECHEQ
jgi:hypothetical protein